MTTDKKENQESAAHSFIQEIARDCREVAHDRTISEAEKRTWRSISTRCETFIAGHPPVASNAAAEQDKTEERRDPEAERLHREFSEEVNAVKKGLKEPLTASTHVLQKALDYSALSKDVRDLVFEVAFDFYYNSINLPCSWEKLIKRLLSEHGDGSRVVNALPAGQVVNISGGRLAGLVEKILAPAAATEQDKKEEA